jgi:hypothetical protein
MADFLSNVGCVLRGVISPPAIKAGSGQNSARETRTLSTTLDDTGSDSGGGGGTGKAPTGGDGTGGGVTIVPRLSSTFRLLVVLNFILIVLLGAGVFYLAIWGDPARPAVQTLFTTASNLLTGSVGAFVGLIGGKAA